MQVKENLISVYPPYTIVGGHQAKRIEVSIPKSLEGKTITVSADYIGEETIRGNIILFDESSYQPVNGEKPEYISKSTFKSTLFVPENEDMNLKIYIYFNWIQNYINPNELIKNITIVEGEELPDISVPSTENVANSTFSIGREGTARSKVSNFQHLCKGGGIC